MFYLLYGFFDDYMIWMRRILIECYVLELGFVVVMLNVDCSFYRDMVYGKKYWMFVIEEFFYLVRLFFLLLEKREDNFVVGFFMGGYGVLKWVFCKLY